MESMVIDFTVTLKNETTISHRSVHTEWDEVVELVRVSKKKLVDAGFKVKETRMDSVVLMDNLSKGYTVTMARLVGGKYTIQVEATAR